MRELRAFHTAITSGVRPQDALGASTDLAWLQGMLSVLALWAGLSPEGEAQREGNSAVG